MWRIGSPNNFVSPVPHTHEYWGDIAPPPITMVAPPLGPRSQWFCSLKQPRIKAENNIPSNLYILWPLYLLYWSYCLVVWNLIHSVVLLLVLSLFNWQYRSHWRANTNDKPTSQNASSFTLLFCERGRGYCETGGAFCAWFLIGACLVPASWATNVTSVQP